MDFNPLKYFQNNSTDCVQVGQLLANYYNANAMNKVPYIDLIKFYRQNGDLSSVSNGTILDGYNGWVESFKRLATKESVKQFRKLHKTAMDRCSKEVCQHIDFPGNPDLAGIGVLVSFGFQLALASTFGIFAVYHLIVARNSKSDWKDFRGVFHTFFFSSVYFNVALAVAAVVSIALDDKTQYTALVANLDLLLSLSSTQALWPLYVLYEAGRPQDDIPGSTFRLLLLKTCLGLLGATLLSTCAATIVVHWGSNFELFCFHDLPARSVVSGLLYAPIGITALGLGTAALRQVYPPKWPLAGIITPEKSDKSMLWRWVHLGMVFLGLATMWVAFGVLWMLRTEMSGLTGESYQENEWGFGQIVAVVAWLPTAVDIVWEMVKLVRQ